MKYAEVGFKLNLTSDAVESDVRYIRKFLPDFAEGGELKVRELAYYVCYRGEFTDDNVKNKREQGIRAMQQAIKQDILENPYENMTFYI